MPDAEIDKIKLLVKRLFGRVLRTEGHLIAAKEFIIILAGKVGEDEGLWIRLLEERAKERYRDALIRVENEDPQLATDLDLTGEGP